MIDKSLFSMPGVPKALAILLLCALVQAACVLGQAYALSSAIVNIWNAQPVAGQLVLLAVFLSCYVCKQLVLLVRDRFLNSFAYQRCSELRGQLLQSIFSSRLRVVRENGTAAVASAVVEGASQVETYLKLILPKMMEMAAMPLVILVAVFMRDWVSGIILLVMFPVIIFFMVLLGRTAKAKAEEQYGTYQRMSNHFIDTLRGIDTLAAFGASIRECSRIWQVSERFRVATVNTLKVATLSSAVLDMCTVFGIGAIAIMLGLRLADGSVALATALPILVLAPEYFRPIRNFAGDFHASLDGKNALTDIFRMLDASDDDDATCDQQEIATWNRESTLELDDVCYGYSPGSPVLKNVNMRVQGFQRIGIVGYSGAGKSTLANLLAGFAIPESGTISIDGTELPSLGIDAWQHQALYIPQDPYIFHASLRDNIAFYTPNATEEQVANAVRIVGLQDLVDELPQGLDTVIGEGARGLSGGQAQRIALARVLLDPSRKVLIFDEPSAHLDIETELGLKERMLPLMEDHLVIFATHRLHWLTDMDIILVMEDGRIVEQGTLPQLLAADGALVRLAKHMGAGFDLQKAGKILSTDGGIDSSTAVDIDTTDLHQARIEQRTVVKTIGGDAPAEVKAEVEDGTSAETIAGVGAETESHAATDDRFARWVRPYFKRYRSQLVKALALGLATFACSALLMYTAGFLISWTADPALPTLAAIMYAVGCVQLFGLGRPITRYVERLVSHDWVFRMTSSLRARLYGIVEAQAMHVKRTHRTGDFLGLLVEDIGHLQNLFLRTIFPTVVAWMLYGATLVFFGIFDVRFALVIAVLFGLTVFLAPLVSLRANRKRVQARKGHLDQLYTELTDDVMGAADWMFAGRSRECQSRHVATQDRAHAAQSAIDRHGRLNDLAEAVLFAVGAVLVVLWAAGHFASGHVGGTSNWIAAFVLGFFPLVEAFAPVADSVTQTTNHSEALRHLNALPREGDIDPDMEAEDGERPCERTDTPELTPAAMGAATIQAHPSSLAIDVCNVSFAYENAQTPVLDGMTLHIPAGQKIAILGCSGAGKSTLSQVVRGDLVPQTGSVLIGEHDVGSIGDDMPRYISLMQQQTYVFNRTLRENLALGNPDATDEQIWDALRKVHLEQVAKRFESGLDTVLDEAGSQFSGGERHRLAFARMLLANTPIVMLDEPMVGLDPAIEHELMETLFQVCTEKTLVMVTHHLQDISLFDRVVFVEDGCVQLDGTPAQLAATSPRFRTLMAFDQGILAS